MTETVDQRAERLLRVAFDLAVRIRDEHPDAAARPLDALDRTELRDLACLLAGLVDVSRTVRELVWWADQTDVPRAPWGGGCGTTQAYRRHVARGEDPDVGCTVAYRRAELARKSEAA
jgi:hypothetical protein